MLVACVAALAVSVLMLVACVAALLVRLVILVVTVPRFASKEMISVDLSPRLDSIACMSASLLIMVALAAVMFARSRLTSFVVTPVLLCSAEILVVATPKFASIESSLAPCVAALAVRLLIESACVPALLNKLFI